MSAKPRLGFLGLGWIGTQRMKALATTDLAEIVALADDSPKALDTASELAPRSRSFQSLEELLGADLGGLDGLVIATPSALHAEQSISALRNKVAVFCQKPLGRNAIETEEIVRTARQSDVLLGVDFSYRFTKGIERIRQLVRSGDLGRIYAANLVFHNAYGPDKSWFYDPALSGGGCVMDLGIHLVDLALYILDSPVIGVTSRLFRGGHPIRSPKMRHEVEDYAVARLDFASAATAQIACSWNLSAGQDAVIEATFHGDRAGATLRNLNGSFYDFTAEIFHGTKRTPLALAPDQWGGRALIDWTQRLSAGHRFDSGVNSVVHLAGILDAIYEAN
jgi:predicted dehydrogenase